MFTRAFLTLVTGFIAALPAPAQTARIVRLTTADDVGISAAFYAAVSNPAPAVILIHSLGQTREEWATFVPMLQHAGFAVLAVDLRGHGESNRRLTGQGPQSVDYHKFASRDFQDMLLDVDTAFNWFTAQPGVDRNRVAIVAASLGANVALRYAAFNEDVAAFLLLSPGMVYQDVRADDVIGKVGHRPLRIVVSRFDGYSFESCKRLIELRKQAGETGATNDLTVCSGSQHGEAMLTGVKQLPGVCIDWLRQALGTGAAATTPQ